MFNDSNGDGDNTRTVGQPPTLKLLTGHVSQGDLPKPIKTEEKICPHQIEEVTSVSDYFSSSTLTIPLIGKAPNGYFCLDGWSRIERAKADNQTEILCIVKYYERKLDDNDLALEKAAHRMKPEGGLAPYVEKVAKTGQLHDKLFVEAENPIVYEHGGRRVSGGSTGNREDDVIGVLCARLGKDRKTILKYLNHYEYVEDSLFDTLIMANATKSFFETAEPHKRRQKLKLEEELFKGDMTDEEKEAAKQEITRLISEKLDGWFIEFQDTGSISTSTEGEEGEAEQSAAGTEGEEQDTSNDETPAEEPEQELNVHTPRQIDENAPLTLDELKAKFGEVLEQAINDNDGSEDVTRFKQNISNLMQACLEYDVMAEGL